MKFLSIIVVDGLSRPKLNTVEAAKRAGDQTMSDEMRPRQKKKLSLPRLRKMTRVDSATFFILVKEC